MCACIERKNKIKSAKILRIISKKNSTMLYSKMDHSLDTFNEKQGVRIVQIYRWNAE